LDIFDTNCLDGKTMGFIGLICNVWDVIVKAFNKMFVWHWYGFSYDFMELLLMLMKRM